MKREDTRIPVVREGSWPSPPSLSDDVVSFTICGDWLREALKIFTTTIVNCEFVRAVMSGLHFHLKGRPILVGTDGRRMVYAQIPDVKRTRRKTLSPIITGESVRALYYMCQGASIEVALSEKAFRFACDDWVLTGKTIEGRYPDYTKVLPKECNGVGIVDKVTLLAALNYLVQFATEKRSPNLVRLKFNKGVLCLDVRQPSESVTAKRFIDCQYEGPDLVLGVNGKYLLEYIKKIRGSKVWFSLRNEISTIKIQSDNELDPIYLLMPVKLRDLEEDAA